MAADNAEYCSHSCRASDKCQREKRKTINGDDLLWAMQTLGFEDYLEPLKLYLTKFREAEVGLQLGLPQHTHKQQQQQTLHAAAMAAERHIRHALSCWWSPFHSTGACCV